MKITSRSVLSFALLAAMSALSVTALAAPPSGQGIVFLGKDCNSPTSCGDNNADSLAISEAKVGSTVWAAVQASGFYNWGYFGSSLTAPNATFYSDFPTMCRWYSADVGTSQSAADRVKYCPPNENYDYWVGSSYVLATPNDGSVDSHYGASHVYQFGGRSLTLESATIVHCSKGTSVCDFGDNVTIKGSCTYSFPALGNSSQPVTRATASVEGELKFEAGSGMSSQLQRPTYLDWSLTGGADAKVLFSQMIISGQPCTAKWFWCGDCSGFTGRFVLNNATATAAAYSILAISNSVVNGTVEVQQYERLQSFGDDAFIARAEIAEGATLDVASDHTTRIGTLVLNGKMNFTTRTSKLGLTEGLTFGPNSSVNFPADVAGTVITMPAGAVFDFSAFLDAMKRGTGNAGVASVKLSDNGDGTKSVIVTAKPTDGRGGMIEIDSDATISGGDAKVRVSVAEGKTLDLINGNDSRMPINLKDDATVNIRRVFEDWSTIPSLWLDASAANSVSNLVVTYEHSRAKYENDYANEDQYLEMGQTVSNPDGYPMVTGWFDCRGEEELMMWNQRYDQLYTPTDGVAGHNIMGWLYPYRVTAGLNGRDYISFGKRGSSNAWSVNRVNGTVYSDTSAAMTRLYCNKFASYTSTGNAGFKPKYAIMVFGSQNGGGQGVLGGQAFARNDGADNPILTDDSSMVFWIDGVRLEKPTEGKPLNGDWQVITVQVNGNSVDGLGYGPSSGSGNGGQNYAEVIFVDQELTEKQRQTIEIYLAEKWGLQDQYAYPEWVKDPFATVYGAGTVRLEANATLGGAFRGTVDLNGNNLVIDGAALPPTEDAVNTDSCIGWFDPDDEKTLVAQQVKGKVPGTRLNWINDKIRGAATGALALHSRQNTRAAGIDRSAHGMGPVRTWLDYANLEGSTDYTGCLSGLRAHTGEKTFGGDLAGGTNVNTMIMVIDSRRGGGNPFFDGSNVNTDDGVVKKRNQKRASDPIYPSGTGAILTEGKTYLDGIEVDGTTQGFSARAEVLSVVPNGNYPLLSFAMLGNSEKDVLCGDDKSYAEIEGEILLWTRALPDAERKVVEAYLSYKWLGLANEGYSDLTAATVTGAGKVTAASAALLPKFAADFTGTVSVPLAEGLAFTLATDGIATTVEGALDFGGGALEIPSGTTSINVSVAKSGAKPKAGSYKLIGWVSKPAVTWNLTLDGWTRESTALRVADDGLYLDLEKVGMTVLIR